MNDPVFEEHKKQGPLNFERLALQNKARCEESFSHGVEGWSIERWACAIAGETGEFCNMVKKLFRGRESDKVSAEDLLKELADIVIYADLTAQKLGGDLGEAVRAKFNEVSERVKSTRYL